MLCRLVHCEDWNLGSWTSLKVLTPDDLQQDPLPPRILYPDGALDDGSAFVSGIAHWLNVDNSALLTTTEFIRNASPRDPADKKGIQRRNQI